MNRRAEGDEVISENMTSVSRETIRSARCESRCVQPGRHLTHEEWRSLQAIIRVGMGEAARIGHYCATFRGCEVQIVKRHLEGECALVLHILVTGVFGTGLRAVRLRLTQVAEMTRCLSLDKSDSMELKHHVSVPRRNLSIHNRSRVASPDGRAAGVTLAESARLMPVTASPLRSKEHPNRPHLLKAGGPKPGDLSASQYPSRGVQSPVRDRSPQLPCERRS